MKEKWLAPTERYRSDPLPLFTRLPRREILENRQLPVLGVLGNQFPALAVLGSSRGKGHAKESYLLSPGP